MDLLLFNPSLSESWLASTSKETAFAQPSMLKYFSSHVMMRCSTSSETASVFPQYSRALLENHFRFRFSSFHSSFNYWRVYWILHRQSNLPGITKWSPPPKTAYLPRIRLFAAKPWSAAAGLCFSADSQAAYSRPNRLGSDYQPSIQNPAILTHLETRVLALLRAEQSDSIARMRSTIISRLVN